MTEFDYTKEKVIFALKIVISLFLVLNYPVCHYIMAFSAIRFSEVFMNYSVLGFGLGTLPYLAWEVKFAFSMYREYKREQNENKQDIANIVRELATNKNNNG